MSCAHEEHLKESKSLDKRHGRIMQVVCSLDGGADHGDEGVEVGRGELAALGFRPNEFTVAVAASALTLVDGDFEATGLAWVHEEVEAELLTAEGLVDLFDRSSAVGQVASATAVLKLDGVKRTVFVLDVSHLDSK